MWFRYFSEKLYRWLISWEATKFLWKCEFTILPCMSFLFYSAESDVTLLFPLDFNNFALHHIFYLVYDCLKITIKSLKRFKKLHRHVCFIFAVSSDHDSWWSLVLKGLSYLSQNGLLVFWNYEIQFTILKSLRFQ